MFASYRCDDCGYTIDYRKKYGEDFPDSISYECDQCSNIRTFRRVFIISPLVSVCQGYAGNAANGYSRSHVYHSSPFTPLNKTRKSKQDSVLSES